jgi:hypothetical protein
MQWRFVMMRLVGDVSKTEAGGMIADKAPRRQMLKRLRKRFRLVLEGVAPSPKSTKNECAPRGPGTRPCTHKIRPNVRFSPKATELPRGSEMTRCARKRHGSMAGARC